MKPVYLLKWLIIILLVTNFKNPVLAQDSAAAKAHLKQGIQSFNAANYNEAIMYTQNSINEIPTAYAYFLLGAAYCNNGNYQLAKENEIIAINYAFNPALDGKRRDDAKYILRFCDSITSIPKAASTYAQTSDGGVSSDPLTSNPEVNINTPADNDNPLEDHTMNASSAFFFAKLASQQENVTIRSSYYCDLEGNGEAKTGDFWWTLDERPGNLVPLNGTRFFLMWSCGNCYDTLTRQALIDYEARELFQNNPVSVQYLKEGNLIAYITRNNLYGVLKFEHLLYGMGEYKNRTDLVISFKTFAN
jgi:hypothetical protein